MDKRQPEHQTIEETRLRNEAEVDRIMRERGYQTQSKKVKKRHVKQTYKQESSKSLRVVLIIIFLCVLTATVFTFVVLPDLQNKENDKKTTETTQTTNTQSAPSNQTPTNLNDRQAVDCSAEEAAYNQAYSESMKKLDVWQAKINETPSYDYLMEKAHYKKDVYERLHQEWRDYLEGFKQDYEQSKLVVKEKGDAWDSCKAKK